MINNGGHQLFHFLGHALHGGWGFECISIKRLNTQYIGDLNCFSKVFWKHGAYIRKILGMYFDNSSDKGETSPHMDEQRRGGGVILKGCVWVKPRPKLSSCAGCFSNSFGGKRMKVRKTRNLKKGVLNPCRRWCPPDGHPRVYRLKRPLPRLSFEMTPFQGSGYYPTPLSKLQKKHVRNLQVSG